MKIIHCFRAPIAGLFRHILDLVPEQARAGHEIGILCDSDSGGRQAVRKLESVSRYCSLGIHRISIPRTPCPTDVKALREARQVLGKLRPDIIHSHGAKGGLIARVINKSIGAKTIYTPHAGVLNYTWYTPVGSLFLTIEKLLLQTTNGLIFVCDYERQGFQQKIGPKQIPFIVNYNSLKQSDFAPLDRNADATDLVFIGEIRRAKGVKYLLQAISIIKDDFPVTATIVGDGPDSEKTRKLSSSMGLDPYVRFTGTLSTRKALACGRVLVLPSIHESFPYVLLEAVAQAMPIVSTDVGGVKALLRDSALVPPANPDVLANAIKTVLIDELHYSEKAEKYREKARAYYNANVMAENTIDFYQKLI